jgi:uncharacterized coiled-coil DUF342 family protein
MNTLRYTQRLEEAGIERRSAEAIVSIQQDAMNETFATKHDFALMELTSKAEFQSVRSEMANEFQAVRSEMANEFQAVRSEMANEFQAVRSEMANEFQAVRSEMANEFQSVRFEMREIESRLTIKMGAMQAVSVGVLLAAIQYIR